MDFPCAFVPLPRTPFQEVELDGNDKLESRRISEYLNLLESRRVAPRTPRTFGAFDELQEIAQDFELILDVNASEAHKMRLGETARFFSLRASAQGSRTLTSPYSKGQTQSGGQRYVIVLPATGRLL